MEQEKLQTKYFQQVFFPGSIIICGPAGGLAEHRTGSRKSIPGN